MLIYENPATGGSCRQASIIREDSKGGSVVGLTHETLLNIMSQKRPDELLALYCFYILKVHDQKTQRIWCTTQYVSKGLGWGEKKVKRVKDRLRKLKLIEDIPGKNVNGKFGKPYVLVRFVNRGCLFEPTGEKNPVGKEPPSAPRGKGNAPRTKEKFSKTYTQADARELGFEEDYEQWIVMNYNRILATPDSDFLPVTKATPELRKALLITQEWDKERLQEVLDSARESETSKTLVRILWDHYEADSDFTPELTNPADDEW